MQEPSAGASVGDFYRVHFPFAVDDAVGDVHGGECELVVDTNACAT